MIEPDLLPEWAMLERIVDRQSPAARELVRCALIRMLIEDGKAEIVERRTADEWEWVTVRTAAGESFSIVKPDESDDMLETPRYCFEKS